MRHLERHRAADAAQILMDVGKVCAPYRLCEAEVLCIGGVFRRRLLLGPRWLISRHPCAAWNARCKANEGPSRSHRCGSSSSGSGKSRSRSRGSCCSCRLRRGSRGRNDHVWGRCRTPAAAACSCCQELYVSNRFTDEGGGVLSSAEAPTACVEWQGNYKVRDRVLSVYGVGCDERCRSHGGASNFGESFPCFAVQSCWTRAQSTAPPSLTLGMRHAPVRARACVHGHSSYALCNRINWSPHLRSNRLHSTTTKQSCQTRYCTGSLGWPIGRPAAPRGLRNYTFCPILCLPKLLLGVGLHASHVRVKHSGKTFQMA